MTLKYLIQKEFLQIRRNAFLPKLIVMFPIVIMCVMPWVMQMEVKNIVVDVVDIDHTVESQRLVQQIAASNYFIFGGQKSTYADAMKDIEKGKADVILEIRDGKYLIAANAVNGTKGSMGSAYLSQIVSDPVSTLSAASVLTLYNKQQNYKLFMIPALFAIVMMLMTGFLPTLNIVSLARKRQAPSNRSTLRPFPSGRSSSPNLSLTGSLRCLSSPYACYWRGSFMASHLLVPCGSSTCLHVRDVVLCGEHHVAVGTFHPYAIHAPVGVSYHLHQPHALLHRCHPHRLYPRRWTARNCPSGLSPCWHRYADGLLGRTEL